MSKQPWATVGIVLESSSSYRLLTNCLRHIEALQKPSALGRCAAQIALRFVIAGVAALVLAPSFLSDRAEAGVLSAPPSLSLTVGIPGNTLTVPVSLTAGPTGSFMAQGSTPSNGSFSLSYQFSVIADPSLTGSFTLTNLSSQTQTFSVSATLGVLPLAAPTRVSGFYGPVLLTAPVGTGEATLTANPFYEAQIDGGAIVSLGNLNVTTSGGSATIPKEVFSNHPGPAVSSSIGVAFPGFTLTGLHSVQVPFDATVVSVPEPASVVLLVLGLAVAVVRWGKLPVGPRRSAQEL
jgi:hypothetical protein